MGSILAQALSLVRVNSPHFTDRVTDTPRPHPALCPTVKTSSVGLLSHKCADFTNTTSSLSSVLSHWAGFPSLCEHTPWDLGISASLSSEPAAGGAGDEWRASTVCAGDPEGVGKAGSAWPGRQVESTSLKAPGDRQGLYVTGGEKQGQLVPSPVCTALLSLPVTGRHRLETNVPNKKSYFPSPHPFDRQQETGPRATSK